MESEVTEDPFGLGCALEMFAESEEIYKMIENLKTIYTDAAATEKAYERFHLVIGQYKEQPHLLDAHLAPILGKCIAIIRSDENAMDLKHCIFKYMFVIVNVRGYKVIVRHLPHEVADFEPVLKLLEAQDPFDAVNWQTRYILLLWLSIIVMIPFHLSRFDGYDSSTQEKDKTVMCRVLDLIKTYVVVSDKCRDAAAYLSARFITRNDVKEQHLLEYFDWAIELSLSPESNVFIKYGTSSSVATILKLGKREDLLPHAQRLLQWIVNEEIKMNAGTNVQKLVYKIVQRIGLIFLPPRVAAWRYKRGNRSLALNLCGGDGAETATASVSTLTISENDSSEDIDVPDEVEEVIDQLIQGLRSEDGIVRWSAAKGVGRVTGRLPQELADQVVGSVLELFSVRESDGAWHGACLALAELGRRGLLLPKRLPEVVPLVLKALVYDEPRGYSSVGSHIRDAACYVCWSFARAYETEVLKPFVNKIAATLLIVVCFDREINCRRAASAAFQENVGRQGTFPHGIDILTTADFFAVSVRHNAYLNISVYIAQFEEYTLPLIDHLVSRKVDHWDNVIRELCAKALHNLTPKALNYMVESVIATLFEKANSIDLNSRHGAVLAIGEILLALSIIDNTENPRKIEDVIGENLVKNVQNLIPNYREKFYFRGLGGELMRHACCDFIEKTSLSTLHFENNSVTEDWLNLLNECIAYNVPNIQLGGIKALPVLLTQHFSSPDDVSKQNDLVRKYVHELLSTTQQEVRMGHALALGSLPKFILKDHLEIVVESLIQSIKVTPLSQKWAESRRDAIEALATLSVTMSEEIGNVFSCEQVLKIYDVFLDGLKDYTQDKRGDVGAWVREASMSGLQSLTFKVVGRKPDLLTVDLVTKIIAGVAQQAVEKIDRTRASAGKVFYSFLYSELAIPNIQNYEDLIKIFTRDECHDLNWNSASDTFPKFVELLQFAPYTYNVMLGLICSVGGLTETLVKNSSSSLFAYLKKEEKSKGLEEITRLCEIIHQIFVDFQKIDRISVPMLRFLEKLFASGCVHIVLDNFKTDYAKRMQKLILTEINGCKEIYKLIDGINVLAQYIHIKEGCPAALTQLSILLCHKQSYVRRSTSTVLYEALLVYGDSANINNFNVDAAMQLLSTTNWEEPVEVLKPIRNQLCTLLGIRIPVPKSKVESASNH